MVFHYFSLLQGVHMSAQESFSVFFLSISLFWHMHLSTFATKILQILLPFTDVQYLTREAFKKCYKTLLR